MKNFLILNLFFFYSNIVLPACTNSVLPSTPTSDFVINNDATVTHLKTGLMWKRCSEGETLAASCSDTAQVYSWIQALELAKSATFAGYNDWRLPNIKELASIIEHQCYEPALNTEVFPSNFIIRTYFSSTSAMTTNSADFIPSGVNARSVNFWNGWTVVGLKTTKGYVRLVRGGR